MDAVEVQLRENPGKRRNRRLRAEGKLPAVLYGHGEETVSLAISSSYVKRAIRHGEKLFELKGGVTEKALLWNVQWDALGSSILHIDLMRVRAGERITVEVPIELRGSSPGTRANGVVDHVLHSVEIETIPSQIPESLEININELNVGDSLMASSLEGLPEEAKLLIPEDTVVVSCSEALEEPEEEEGVPSDAAEPEVIGRKKEDEEEGSE